MYAIIRTGGKQARVSPGDVLDVERLKGAGEEVSFTPILVVPEMGDPVTDREALGEIQVKARVLGEVKGEKLDIFKYKPKSGYRRRMGHRQKYTRIEITDIEMPKAKAKPKKKAEAEAPEED